MAAGDQGYIEQTSGPQIMAFLYLGAKHMVTGYDHLLFLFGVIFFLYRVKDIATYVTLFAIGHSHHPARRGLVRNQRQLLCDRCDHRAFGGLQGARQSRGIPALVRVSAQYQSGDADLRLLPRLWPRHEDAGISLSPDGLLANLLAFNVGVEIGQLLALGAILIAMGYWRRTASFCRFAFAANVALMTAGFVLFGYQLTGYFAA